MKTTSATRLQILYLLRQKGSATAILIAEEFGFTLSAARQQLSILESEGLIEAEVESGRRGRPLHHYVLTDQAEQFFTKSYAALTLELLDELIEDQGKSVLHRFLLKRQKKMEKKHREAIQEQSGLKNQVQAIAKVQDDAGYMASVKKEGKLVVLQEHNCPFIEVAKKYPEFCEAEKKVYEEVLGRRIRLDGCRARGANVCRFCIEDINTKSNK